MQADQRTYPHGVPCWVDTEQPDLKEASRFYGALFGWHFEDAVPAEAPGSYLIATLDGHDVAAIAPGGGAAGWSTYIACDDADRTAEAVVAAGGTVLAAPEDAGPGGRAATCADPDGAVFRLWQARRRLGAQLVNVPNTWNFSDLHTLDPERGLAFYAAVFGWETELHSGSGMVRLPGYGDHLASTIDPGIHERQAGAPPGFADVVAGAATDDHPAWRVRFTVADRDASVATAEAHGAVVLSSADTMWTREAVIRDPQGAELTVSQFAPPH
jgi:predicted enzyme related to lactoylglutathione lyase